MKSGTILESSIKHDQTPISNNLLLSDHEDAILFA